MSAKRIAIPVAIAFVLGTIWVGGSMYAQRRFQTEMASLNEQIRTIDSRLRIENEKHERGFLTSSGEFTVVLDYPTLPVPISFKSAYQASHFITPSAVTSTQWSIKPAGMIGTFVNKMFQTELQVSGTAKMGLTGSISSTLEMPKLIAKTDAVAVDLGPLTGHFSHGQNTRSTQFDLPRVMFEDKHFLVDIKDIKYQADYLDINAMTSVDQISIREIKYHHDTLSDAEVLLSDFVGKGKSDTHDGRLNVALTTKTKSFAAKGHTISGIEFDYGIKNLDVQSVRRLKTIFQKVRFGGLDKLQEEDETAIHTALKDIVLQGFVFDIPNVKASSSQGVLEGKAFIELGKSASEDPLNYDLTKQLQSSGQLVIKDLISPVKDMLRAMQVGQDSPEGYKLAYDLREGKLSFDGKTINVSDKLAESQSRFRKFLNNPKFLSQK